jgi:diguanylate cyclase (GGDEF)-like protein
MKHSIAKIFSHLSTYLLFILFIGLVGTFLIIEQKISFSKVNNLENQKKIISSLVSLSKSDANLALIELNAKDSQLRFEIEKLYDVYKYNITDKFFLGNEDEYLADLERLKKATGTFTKDAIFYYSIPINNSLIGNTDALEEESKISMQNSYEYLYKHIDTMLLKNINYDENKFGIIENLAIFSFVVILIFTFWFRRRLHAIYEDIKFLYAVRTQGNHYSMFSLEMDAIGLKMKRKAVPNENPAFIDQVTGINNHKGMLTSYAEKKGMKDNNFTSVTVLEIDNFSKTNRAYSQELTQSILKKVAFTLSLHEQPTDVIARTDYNQFTLIFSRQSKELSFKDIEKIRQSISEIKISTPEQGVISITVSGGFVIKENNVHLDESIKIAKGILEFAQSQGGNKIAQIRDVANSNL